MLDFARWAARSDMRASDRRTDSPRSLVRCAMLSFLTSTLLGAEVLAPATIGWSLTLIVRTARAKIRACETTEGTSGRPIQTAGSSMQPSLSPPTDPVAMASLTQDQARIVRGQSGLETAT